jgi:hypothetical protein
MITSGQIKSETARTLLREALFFLGAAAFGILLWPWIYQALAALVSGSESLEGFGLAHSYLLEHTGDPQVRAFLLAPYAGLFMVRLVLWSLAVRGADAPEEPTPPSPHPVNPLRRLMPREQRLMLRGLALVLLALLLDILMRTWLPREEAETAHYRIVTTASPKETESLGRALEVLLAEYRSHFAPILPEGGPEGKFQVRFYRNRKEFRRCNRAIRWAEAYYRYPFINAYNAPFEINSYHSFLHEGVHQLNHELGRFPLEHWLSEGLACYFSSSRISAAGTLDLRLIDLETYPSFWLYTIARTGDFEEDVDNGSVIPLRTIIANAGGPAMDEHFNLYYLHWWTLVYFLCHFEEGKYAPGLPDLVKEGGTLPGFERHLGPVDRLQSEWYEFVVALRKGVTDGTAPLIVEPMTATPPAPSVARTESQAPPFPTSFPSAN